MKRDNVDMLSGSITKGLLAMSIPIMVMNVMQSLFGVIDMTVLRYFCNEQAVGAVGASGTLNTLCTSLLIGIAAGANVVVAKRIGLGDKKGIDKAGMTALWVSFAGGILLMIAGVLLAEILLKMTNCPKELLEQATLYFRNYFYSVPGLIVYYFCSAILRAMGDTKKPMYFLLLSGVVKIIFGVIFITAFDMDVDGVAYATIIANFMAGGLTLRALLKKKEIIHIHFKNMCFEKAAVKEMLYIGIPAGLQSALYSVANLVIMATVNSFGADATTGISIANQFDAILYQISCAPSLATIPYVAQNIGAKNIKRVKQTVVRAVLITTAFGATLGAGSAIFSGQLSSIMSTSDAVIAYSQQKMILISSTYFICGINEVIGGVLKGMGKPIIPTIATFVFMCVFRFVWVYGIFPLCPNLTFLYLVWPIGWTLSIITLLFVYFPAISKLQKSII